MNSWSLVPMLLLCINISIIVGCRSQNKSHGLSEYVVDRRNVIFSPFSSGGDSLGYLILSNRHWLRNRKEIEEVRTLIIVTDTANKTSRELALDCFLFKNFDTNKIYEYLHFSDSVKPVKVFLASDSVSLTKRATYSPIRRRPYVLGQKAWFLPDTVIASNTFKRVFQHIPMPGDTLKDIFYLQCNLDHNLLNIYNLDDSINRRFPGCLAVKMTEANSNDGGNHIYSSYIQFHSSKFSSEEKRVFDAWEKNEARK
jgi:hypothetical protein